MSEKSISERGKDTLKWIQKEQKANDLGMVKSAQVPDQDALRFLLRKGDAFEPLQGMIKTSIEPQNESASGPPGLIDNKPWIWRTPKPKSKNDKPEPYEFLPYPEFSILPSTVSEALRGMGFSGDPYLYEGYSYRKMAGGALRRKMIGKYSREEMFAELKLIESDVTDEAWDKFEQEINDKIAEYKGKYKQFPEVQICPNLVYYPKDGSFSIVEKQ